MEQNIYRTRNRNRFESLLIALIGARMIQAIVVVSKIMLAVVIGLIAIPLSPIALVVFVVYFILKRLYIGGDRTVNAFRRFANGPTEQ